MLRSDRNRATDEGEFYRQRIDQALAHRPITFAKLDRAGVNVNTDNLCAYVFLVRTGQHLAHFGSGMRIMVVWKTHAKNMDSYLAQTIYHELSHKVGTGRITTTTNNRAWALRARARIGRDECRELQPVPARGHLDRLPISPGVRVEAEG